MRIGWRRDLGTYLRGTMKGLLKQVVAGYGRKAPHMGIWSGFGGFRASILLEHGMRAVNQSIIS
jgi:hypothetical protein